MTRNRQLMKDILVSAIILCVSFGMSLLFQYVFDVQEHIPTVFVFAVFLISLLTNGYACGILASFFGMIAVNYAFTFPYFALNFSIPVNLVSAIVMIVVSVLTSALTTKLKQHEAIKAESEMEHMRATHENSVKKLQVNMANIRKKFGARPGEANDIINELGVGYRMNAERE